VSRRATGGEHTQKGRKPHKAWHQNTDMARSAASTWPETGVVAATWGEPVPLPQGWSRGKTGGSR
jgi:hypothetical protein